MPINTRHFEQVTLCEEVTGHIVLERRYSDGEVAYWSQQTITIQDQQKRTVGQVAVPFKIDVPSDVRGPDEVTFWRQHAFANYLTAMKAAEPAAHALVREQLKQQEKQAKSQIVLAQACPPLPVQ